MRISKVICMWPGLAMRIILKSLEDDSEDEEVPEVAAPALEQKFLSSGRRIPPPVARYG